MSFATADLCDQHEDLLCSGRLRVAEPIFRTFGGRTAMRGRITTLKLFEDNSLVRPVLETPGDGRVLVIDGGGSLRRAIVGDQLAALAARNGWQGILAWGCIRDAQAIAAMDLAVFALATHPRKTEKNNTGAIDVPVSFGGVTFRPGDWLYADLDGILVADGSLD